MKDARNRVKRHLLFYLVSLGTLLKKERGKNILVGTQRRKLEIDFKLQGYRIQLSKSHRTLTQRETETED